MHWRICCAAIYAQYGVQHHDADSKRGAPHFECLLEDRLEGLERRSTSEGPDMDELFADGGVIRKVWIGEAEKYRDHLLRLDAESRRNRFGGAIADALILAFAETAMAGGTVMDGVLVDW